VINLVVKDQTGAEVHFKARATLARLALHGGAGEGGQRGGGGCGRRAPWRTGPMARRGVRSQLRWQAAGPRALMLCTLAVLQGTLLHACREHTTHQHTHARTHTHAGQVKTHTKLEKVIKARPGDGFGGGGRSVQQACCHGTHTCTCTCTCTHTHTHTHTYTHTNTTPPAGVLRQEVDRALHRQARRRWAGPQVGPGAPNPERVLRAGAGPALRRCAAKLSPAGPLLARSLARRFVFDGTRVNPNSTPEDLGMEEGERGRAGPPQARVAPRSARAAPGGWRARSAER
jgi:hypothetical protein